MILFRSEVSAPLCCGRSSSERNLSPKQSDCISEFNQFLEFRRLSAAPLSDDASVFAVNGFGLGTPLAALFGLGAGTEAPVASADKFTHDSRRFTLNPRALRARFTLSTSDAATRSQ